MSAYHRWKSRWTLDDEAIVGDDFTLTYRELDEQVARARGWLLQQGIQPGDTVAIQLEKGLLFVHLHLACLSMGAVTLPINPAYPDTDRQYLLVDAGAKLLVAHHVEQAPCTAFADHEIGETIQTTQPAPLGKARLDDELAMLLYTSGTTGKPKGAELTHGNLIAMVLALHSAWQWSPADRIIHMLPIFHVHGLFVAFHGCLAAGATCLWFERFNVACVVRSLQEQAPTIFMGVPTYHQRLLADPSVPSMANLRLVTSGSAPLPASVHAAFEQRFHQNIIERYGMTEVGIVMSNPLSRQKAGTVGLPLPGIKMKITDAQGQPTPVGEVGEVRIRGASVFRGYRNRPQATEEAIGDGWMHTGDLGRLDDDGYLQLVGRATDMILTGGLNVYPVMVERQILSCPTVVECAVFGVPHPDFGEAVVAAVVGELGPEERERINTQLANYQRPKQIFHVDELPRNAMGKVQKKALRQRYGRPTVRVARPDDLAFLVGNNIVMALETEGVQLERSRVERGVERVLSAEVGATFLIGEIAGARAGQLMWTTEWSDWRAQYVWWIQSVFVHPSCRRLGVYRALYEALVVRAKQEGCAGIRLYVDKRNQQAIQTYKDLGMDTEHYLVCEAMFEDS